ncbi:hypothetical protein DPX16_16224 [Anabarilius grahami]|uniref:Uncharacterized protein n=1 Tax=Anabarilius grahami TaxID=495550 RepID=A0A3N0XFH2_ANAGA|nr:hypothetical protein DPX16_16224 [Anabarilius grahami]
MQHIRIMEGVSRSLPSSPLLSHQAINMRLQPLKRLPARTTSCFLSQTLPLNARTPAESTNAFTLHTGESVNQFDSVTK